MLVSCIMYKPDIQKLWILVSYLHSLLLHLKPCKSIASYNAQCLSQSHSTITRTLNKAITIELYNETEYGKPHRTSKPSFDYNHLTVDFKN